MSIQSEPMSLDEIIEDSQMTSEQANKFSSFKTFKSGDLRSIDELHPKYRHIFQYPYFNKIQSKILDDVLYTDKSLVVSAPTGSGKTVLLELAIVRLLMALEELNYMGDFKIVYMAPVKALCTERLSDWYGKFSKLGLPCIEVTGDTDSLDFNHLKFYKIIMTTPEKWDSLTRRWKDHKLIVQMVKLFIIDEVHLLNEDVRGPVLEAVVSRMKTIQSSLKLSKYAKKSKKSFNKNKVNSFDTEDKNVTELNTDLDDTVDQLPVEIRFIAVSATIPNAEDIAEWLGTKEHPAACYKIGEEYRPVKLKKVVEGFPFKDGQGLFKFDMYLSYKLRPIIERYCDGKPTLIFCNTRKSVLMTAEVLSRELMFQFSQEQSLAFAQMASRLSEKKLQVLVRSGIGCHHAGFIQSDRNIIEQMFRQGDLPLLITTSTLAMGVNLPAHLVIIKTTQFYNNGAYQEYEESTVLQMMGRAGRPQFDTEGVAVILTKLQDKNRYTSMCGGTRCVESALHRHLSEHLNAEAALGTLADLLQAMDWIRSTFLYVRAVRNPAHYGYPARTSRDTIEKRLEELCLKCVNALARAGMLTMDSNTVITSTEAGVLMAAHCLDFETMKLIIKVKGTETLSDFLGLLSKCHEYCDVPLRTGEKRCLNLLNRRPRGQAAEGAAGSCRFPLAGRVQTRDMKVNCLIQAIFGSLPIPDPSLNQEATKVLRIGDHISKCIVNYTTRPSALAEGIDKPIYQSVLNSVILAKCFAARLWENSCFIVRQLNGIGPILATLLVSAGKTTFQSIHQSNPRDLERIMNKLPPTGNILKKQVALLPLYELEIKCEPDRVVEVTLSIANYDQLFGQKSTAGEYHRVTLIIGDSENNLLLFEKILDTTILESNNNEIKRRVMPKCSFAHTVNAHCISNTWVGLDVKNSINVKKTLFSSLSGLLQQNIQQYLGKNIRGSTKFKGANEIIQEEMMEAIADFSPQIQTDFLNEENDIIFESNDNQRGKKDVQNSSTVKKKPRNAMDKPKNPLQKNCDVAKGGKGIMEKINNYIKSIPEPSHLNTLSSNITYYRPLPKSAPQDYSVNFESKQNNSLLNESSMIKGNRNNYYRNVPTICTSNSIIPRVQYDINRTQQQNIVKKFHPQTDIDKPANAQSLHANLMSSEHFPSDINPFDLSEKTEINSSDNFNGEKYSLRQDYEHEQNAVVEDVLNSSEDETYEVWYKKLDTQNTNDSFVSKTQIFKYFPSQNDDSFTKHSITEREIEDRNIHNHDYNYLTHSESQFSSQQNNLQPVTPSLFLKKDYTFRKSTESFKNSLQASIANDSNKHVFENNKIEAPPYENHRCETFHPSTLQDSETFSNPRNIDFAQNRPAYNENAKRIAPQTETFQHSNTKYKKIAINNISRFNKMKEQEISVCEKNQWTVPNIFTNFHTSPGSSGKINLMKPNEPKRIISSIDLTEDETIQWGENDLKVDSINKETKPNNTTLKVLLKLDKYSKKPSSTISKKLHDESKFESEFNDISLNKLTTTLNQSLNSVVKVAKSVQNNLDFSMNICEKGINNISVYNSKLNKTKTTKKNECDEKITNTIPAQTPPINLKQNKTMMENPIKKPKQRKIAYQALPICEIVNSSDDEIIFVENLILQENKSDITVENLKQSEYDGWDIVHPNLLNKIQYNKPESQSIIFTQVPKTPKPKSVQDVVKCDKSVQQNNSMENYYKSIHLKIQFFNQIHITNNFQKFRCITFNNIPRPFTFDALPKTYKCRKFKSVTWRDPLILLPPRASNILPGNVINQFQNKEYSLVKKNLSVIGRNHKFTANISAKRPIMSVMKSVMELPLNELLSLYSFNTTANNIIEISLYENIGNTMCNSSQDKIRELEDIQEDVFQEKDTPSKPLKNDLCKPFIELLNDENTLKEIAERGVSQIIESNMTDARDEVDITREVSSSLERKTELLFAVPSKKICNKESYVKDWLKKSPFNCFPSLEPDTNESKTASREIEITKDLEEEKIIEIVNEHHPTTENMFTTMITSSLLKYKPRQDLEKVVDKNNDFDGIEDLESNWEKDCNLNKKPPKSQKLLINSLMNYNAEIDWDIYRDSHNKRENFQSTAIKEPEVVRLENDNIISDYQHSLQGNYFSVCNNTLSNDPYIRFDNEDVEEDWINKFDVDLVSQNMYHSDSNEIVDQNLFNPQHMIASAYCSSRHMEDPEMVHLPQGEHDQNTRSKVSFQVLQEKTMYNVEPENNDLKHDNYHIPSTRVESENYENLPKYYESGIQESHNYGNIVPKNLRRHYENATQNADQNQYSSFQNVSNDYSRSLFGNFNNYNSPLASQSNVNMYRAQYMLETQSQPTVNVSTERVHFQNSNNQGMCQFHSQVHGENVSGNLFLSQFEKPPMYKLNH